MLATGAVPAFDPDDGLRVVPDWICEVLSPSNSSYDRKIKFPFYARVGVPWLWVIDPRARTLEVKRLLNGAWMDSAVFAEEQLVRAEPFGAVEFPLSALWLP
ncbi:MAG: Uma2 family endonuclease [Myxococcota bacterium]